MLFYIITRLKSKSNVREKRGDGVLISFSNSIRRRMWIKEEEKIDTYIYGHFSILVHHRMFIRHLASRQSLKEVITKQNPLSREKCMKMNVYLLTKEKTSVRLIKSEEEKKYKAKKIRDY